jgi:hypothetical protein
VGGLAWAVIWRMLERVECVFRGREGVEVGCRVSGGR